MKYLTFILLLLASNYTLLAQCDYNNSDLEAWSTQPISFDDDDPNLQYMVDLPDDHTSVLRFFFYSFGIAFGDQEAIADFNNDPQAAIGISQSTDANSGNSAVQLQANSYINFSDLYSVWRCTELPDSVEFSVKHVGDNVDTLFVLTVFDEGLSAIPQDFDELDSFPAYAISEIIFDSTTNYQNIRLPLVENFTANIDTAYMFFILTTPQADVDAGIDSYILLDDLGVFSDEVLALEFSGFDAKQSNQEVICSWQTQVEINTAEFVVERSIDGNRWNSIGSLQAAGNTFAQHDYQFIDKSPVAGIQYYRLREIDLNNHSSYSNVVAVNFDTDITSAISLYPNPATNVINIEISEDINYISSLYDLEGRLILKNVNSSTMEIQSVPNGSYLLEVVDQDSGQKFIETVIIEN